MHIPQSVVLSSACMTATNILLLGSAQRIGFQVTWFHKGLSGVGLCFHFL